MNFDLRAFEHPPQSSASFAGYLSGRVDAIGDDEEAWVRECLRVADVQCAISASRIARGDDKTARDGWIHAATAFQAAMHLVGADDRRHTDIAARLRVCTRNLFFYADPPGEAVDVPGFGHRPLCGYFLPACRANAPVVICIGDEREPLDALRDRILPAAAGKGMSLLLVEISDIADASRSGDGDVPSDVRLGDCIDYLLSRSDVCPDRIAVCGDGLAGSVATRLAISDRRITAAVCDGGLWDSIRTRMAVEWMAGPAEPAEKAREAVRRSRLARRIPCPFLIVASEQNVGSVEEATALHRDCRELGIKMDLQEPQAVLTAADSLKNFVCGNAFRFDWLARQLAVSASHDADSQWHRRRV